MKKLSDIRLQRRELLTGLLALSCSPALLAAENALPGGTNREIWLSAEGKNSEDYGLARVSQYAPPRVLRSGIRGHGMGKNPRNSKVVLFPRYPGTQAVEFDLNNNAQQMFTSMAEHVMSGHGVFSADGQYLYCVEVSRADGSGVISVRNSTDYKILRQFNTGGIGPHEIKWLPDNKTLVVANGGLITDANGKTINLANMDSNLTYLEASSGAIISQWRVAEPKASLRHIDVSPQGQVAIAIQLQREACNHQELVPLCALHDGKNPIELLNAPATLLTQLQDYVGSVCISPKSNIAGFTSPRGNLACFWHIGEKQILAYQQMQDVCGITLAENGKHFILSNSAGQIQQLDAFNLKEIPGSRITNKNLAFDNHMLTVQI